MKRNKFPKLLFFVFFIAFAGGINESAAAHQKQSNHEVIFPTKKNPSSKRKNYPVWTKKQHNLPPGQAKKVYGDRSARDYSPGHQKNNRKYSNGVNYNNRKYNKHHNYKNEHSKRNHRNHHHRNGHGR